MASKIRIYRSTGATAPGSLEYGELAVTIEQGTNGTSANKAGRLFVGNSSGNPVEIGGEYTYKLMDHTHGELINSSVAIVDTNGQINGWNVAGITTSTRTDFVDTVTSNLRVTGITTFDQGVNLSGNTTIGEEHTDTLTVNARSGFNTAVTVNDDLLVTGIATINSGVIVNNGGISVQTGGDSQFADNVKVGLALTVQGGLTLSGDGGLRVIGQGANITGVSTFNDDVYFSGIIDVDGGAIFDDVTVSSASTFSGAVDMNGGLDVSGGESVFSSATVSDLTNNRVVIAGTAGSLEDDGNLTYDGTDLSTNSLIVTDLTENRVILAGVGGSVQDSSSLTFDGSILDVDGTIDAGTAVRSPVGVITALTSTDVVGTAGTFTNAFTLGSGVTKYSFPVTDGSPDQILVTDGSGTLSFQDVSSDLIISAGYASTDRVDLLADIFTIAATDNETKTTISDNTITVGLATDVVVGGGLTVTNDLLVLGNLTVEGTETVINVERLDVQDKTVGVASTSTASNTSANGGGFFVHGGGDGDKTIFWDLTQSGFQVNQDWLPESDDSYSLGNSNREWQNLFVDGLAELDDVNVSAAATINTLNVTGTGTIATADINGGNIDGTAIGAASSSTAIFTTLDAGTVVTGGRLDAGETTFSTLRVTGISTVASLFFSTGTNTNGVGYFDANGQLKSTATPSAGIQTSNYILTTNASGVPSWTDTIDGGTF